MTNENTRIGEKFITNEGYEIIVIEYNGRENVVIEFQDEYKTKKKVCYSQCKSGSIKNPYHPSIPGIGCLGLMSDGSRPKTKENGKITREYNVWKGMLQRCYDGKERHKTYKNCTVAEEWHCYATFLQDLPSIEGYELWFNNPNQHISLDKDIKQQDVENKIYSLETVCFVTNEENVKEMIDRCGHPSDIQGIKVYGVNIKTGEKTKIFNSMNEAERELGINNVCIGRCVNGKIKKTHGYRWYKVEENLD